MTVCADDDDGNGRDDKKKSPPKPVTERPDPIEFELPIMTPEEAARLGIPYNTAMNVARALGAWLGRITPSDEEAARSTAPRAAPMPSEDDEPQNPDLLPVVISHAVMDGRLASIRWAQVNMLPGYGDPRIRTIGSAVFNSFPCYRAFAERMKAEGRDPHGEVRVMSFLTHDMSTVANVAKAIMENGQMLERGANDYGAAIPEYHPDIALFLTKGWTFKLVKDSCANGSPFEMVSIYAWPGGTAFYKKSKPVPVQGLGHIALPLAADGLR